MGLEVGLVGELIALEAWCLDDVLQHVAHVAVYVLDVYPSLLHRLHDVLGLCGIARHHQVVAGSHLLFGRQLGALAYPVGHHDTLVAPFVAQHGGQQVFVALGIDPVDEVVRRHQRPGLAAADSHLEALQVELAQGSLAQALVSPGARRLLRVDGKVLGRDAYALALYALDDRRAYQSRHDRVFRVVFEVASAERVAVQVHAWSQHDVDTIFQRLVADGLSHLFHQVGVPRRCQTRADGESRGIERLGSAVAVGVDVYPGRSVGHHGGRDAQPVDGHGGARSPGHQFLLVTQHGPRAYEGVVAAANQQLCFLLECHGLQYLVDVFGRQSCLCIHRYRC